MKHLWLVLAAFLAAMIQLQAVSYPPVYFVLFTHIEDNTPSGDLSTLGARTQYINTRSKMIEMAKLALRYQVQW